MRLGYVVDMCVMIAHGTELPHRLPKRSASDGCHSWQNDSNNECCHSYVQITLLSVYKMDEATRKPTTDAAAIERFTVKLKKLAARQVDLQLLFHCHDI